MEPTRTGREVILHPRIRYGCYIISLFDLWAWIRTELSHHYRYTADRAHDQTIVDHDVDQFLEKLVEQSHFRRDYPKINIEPVRDIVDRLLGPDSHYDFQKMELHQFIAAAMQWYFDFLAQHLPWLIVTPDLEVTQRMRNRFDLKVWVGPRFSSTAKTYPLLGPR